MPSDVLVFSSIVLVVYVYVCFDVVCGCVAPPLSNLEFLNLESRIVHVSSHHRRRGKEGNSYTTICLRASRGLRMNLRVRSVTGESAILSVVKVMLERERDAVGG
jgi:hypothetical protein